MSGLVIQTNAYQGATIFSAHQSAELDELTDFPRFLCRDDAEPMTNMPPPLPHAPWHVRVQWMMRRVAPRRMAALAAALVVLVPAAAALVLDAAPAQINVIQVKSIDQAPAQVPDTLQTAAELEARLEFGLALANLDVPAQAALPPADPSVPPDAPGLLILRNLPENVTFTTGAPSGKGEWVMAAGDPNQLDKTLGEGSDQPVAADVELISHAGLTLGNLHLELRRNVAAVAEAQATPEPQEPVALAEAEKAEPKVEANEAEAQPRKHVRRASARSKSKIARADGGYIKRLKKPDRWKTETVEAADSAGNQKNTDAGAVKTEDETAKGPVAKFFSWLKPGGTQTAPAEGLVDETKATLFPYQGPR